VAAQLLAVARDEQQRVVGSRPEDEYGQDAGALAVDGDPRFGDRPSAETDNASAVSTLKSGITQKIGER
jgi:hypothetical protein